MYKSQSVETIQMPSSTDECINKMDIYIMEYYSAIERNAVLTHVTTWMNIENMIN